MWLLVVFLQRIIVLLRELFLSCLSTTEALGHQIELAVTDIKDTKINNTFCSESHQLHVIAQLLIAHCATETTECAQHWLQAVF